MRNTATLNKDFTWSFQTFINNDDELLEQMRALIKDYLLSKKNNASSEVSLQECKKAFGKLRSQLRDPMLQEFSSFDFMKKLYMQEFFGETST